MIDDTNVPALVHPHWCPTPDRCFDGGEVVHQEAPDFVTAMCGDVLVGVARVQCDEFDRGGKQVVRPGEIELTTTAGCIVFSVAEARVLSELLARRAEDLEADEPGDIPVAEPVVVELSEDGWARLNEHTRSVANPTKALSGGPRDDIDRLQRRMDDLAGWEAGNAVAKEATGDVDRHHDHGDGATEGGEQ